MPSATDLKVLPRNTRELTRDYALRCLEYNISSLHLKPGQFVSEASVCEQLGISRTPVREAFTKLANESLLVIYPQVGTCVSLINAQQVQEARFTRWVLEKAVIERVCKWRTQMDMAWLKQNVQEQKSLIASHDYTGFLDLDNLFHKKFFEIGKAELTRTLVQGLLVHFDRVRLLYLKDMDWNRTIDEHEQLLSALEDQDCAKAVQVMDIHLSRVLADMDILSKIYPEYFVS